MIDVVLVIPDGALRHALAGALRAHADLHLACVTGEADCLDAALDACDPHVLVLDVGLLSLWAARSRGTARSPRVIVCAESLDMPEVATAVEHGVHGCLPRNADPLAWRDAVLAVGRGDHWIPRRLMADALMRLAARMPHEAPAASAERTGLTARQREIVQCVAEGLSNKAIARRLCISPKTVKTHLQNIFERSGLHGRQQLAIRAIRQHWEDGAAQGDAASSPVAPSGHPMRRAADLPRREMAR